MIPKHIHQIWIGDLDPPTPWLETVKKTNPEFKFTLWTEKNIPKDLVNQELFDRATYLAEKTDILRYELLYRYGGVYIDADTIGLQNLAPLIETEKIILAYEHESHAPSLISNGFIGATKKHPFLKALIDNITLDKASDGIECVKTTGPLYLTSIYKLLLKLKKIKEKDVHIYPSHTFYPLHWSDFQEPETLKNFKLTEAHYLFQAWGAQLGYSQEIFQGLLAIVEKAKQI